MKPLKVIALIAVFAVFGILLFTARLLAEGLSATDYANLADAGFSLLETVLVTGLFGTGGMTGVLLLVVRSMKKGTKSIAKAIDSNPDIDNAQLLHHAKRQGEHKAFKVLQKAIGQPGNI